MIRNCLLIAALTCVASAQRHPIVHTLSGTLEGTQEMSGFFHRYFAFRGIPYAEPPVGELRFRNPVAHKGWSGVRSASRHGDSCPSKGVLGLLAGGSEDCLFLNVYSPNLAGDLPVMVWIHGGAFLIGDGNSFVYGPELLLRENVVIVTLNYRLSALGFLSTGDKHAQGNYALKDMAMALQWVNENVKLFGGNPKKITIFGQSAGSAAVHMLLLSKMSQGLFQQAIMMSGTAFSPFALHPNPRNPAEALGRRLGLEFNSTESLVTQLRQLEYRKLVEAENGLFGMENPEGLVPFDFVPSVEPEDSIEERFLFENPIKTMLSGDFQAVPMMIGTTSNEGLIMVRQTLVDPGIFDQYNEHDEFLVPMSFGLQHGSPEVAEVAEAFRKLYFNNQNLSRDHLDLWAKFHTDAQFKFCTDRTVKILAKQSAEPIYYYDFDFAGALNFLKNIQFLRSYDGACHADDIFYLFSPEFPLFVWPTDHALTIRRRHIRLFTNFAKFGNPTPTTDDLIDKLWPTYTNENEEFFHIDSELSVRQHHERLKVWHEFQQRFTGHM